MKNIALLFLLLFQTISIYGQNGFKIGLFSGYCTTQTGCSNTIHTAKDANGNYTSILSTYAEDGCNLTADFFPDFYCSYSDFGNYLKLVQNNGMQFIDHVERWYKYDLNRNPPYSTDFSQQQSGNPNRIVYNYDNLITNYYTNPTYSGIFYGHQFAGEMWASNHMFPYFGQYFNCPLPPSEQDVSGCWKTMCVDPRNISDAANHFMSFSLPSNQAMIMAEGLHEYFVDANNTTADPVYGGNSPWSSNDYLKMNGVTNPTWAGVLMEQAYYLDNFNAWASTDPVISKKYLGKFITMDYARTLPQHNWTRQLCLLGTYESTDPYDHNREKCYYHSNPNIPNGNRIRFMAYTSIIHGAEAVLWYGDGNDPTNTTDVNNRNYLRTATNDPARFNDRTRLPLEYRKTVAPLLRQLRYLVQEGFLTGTQSNVLTKKTTTYGGDPYFILPPSTSYLPVTIQGDDLRDYYAINNIGQPYQNMINPHRDEFYGLRYVLLNNGTETVMIISNPNPYSVHNANLNFITAAASIPSINNANFAEVLFDDGAVMNVNSTNYRMDVTTDPVTYGVDISGTHPNYTYTLKKKHIIPFCNKQMNFDFGPFDVKVVRFKSGFPQNVSYNNGWQQLWSNNANGIIGSWGTQIPATDKFIALDYNHDNDDELVCVQNNSTNSWFSVQNYANGTWTSTPLYTNSGNGFIGSPSVWDIEANDKFISGDFNGDGKLNELLCVRSSNTSAPASIIRRPSTNNFISYWASTNGYFNKLSNSGWQINAADKYIVGDFNGDSKQNDILCVQGNGTWASILNFNTSANNFSVYWSNNGNNNFSSLWTIANNDEYTSGDFNGDGVKNEVLCMNRSSGVIKLLRYNTTTSSWIQLWANGNNGIIGDWGGMPMYLEDVFLAGDIDYTDTKEELFCIQRRAENGWAMTQEFNSTNNFTANWVNGWLTGPQRNYIDNWPVHDSYATTKRYMLIKPVNGEKRYLLSFYDYGCNNSLISMYKVNSTTANYRQELIENNNDNLNEITQVYPNPAKSEINIIIHDSEKYQIGIYDLSGKLMLKTNNAGFSTKIDLTSFDSGVYLVAITNEKRVFYKKIIVGK